MKKIALLVLCILSFNMLLAQDIIYFGNGIEVTTSEDNFPQPGDNTHFGNVDVGASQTYTFEVRNVHHSNIDLRRTFLSIPISPEAIQITGLDASEFTKTEPLKYRLVPNESTTFTVTFTPNSLGVKDAVINIKPTGEIFFFGYSNPLSNNSFNVRGVGMGPELVAYQSGGTSIEHNNVASPRNGTDFEEISISDSETRYFTLKNQGNKDLEVSNVLYQLLESQSGEYSTSGIPSIPFTIAPNDEIEFSITYTPQDLVADTQSIEIFSNNTINPFVINFHGNGTNAQASKEIMITQYHIDNGWQNDFIEVKNISTQTINNGTYSIGVYRGNRNLNQNPGNNWIASIGSLAPGEVKVFKRSDFGNTNGQFLNGTRLAVISTASGSYGNRVDMIGVHGNNWSGNASYNKGGCASETTHVSFNINHWVAVDVAEVASANNNQNIAEGVYNQGAAIWNGSAWVNGAPDISRTTMIDGNYNAVTNEILRTCSLVVNSGSTLNFNNAGLATVEITKDLTVNGNFVLGDQASLVMYNDNASISGQITKLEQSTSLNSRYDVTYWSSPVRNANLGTVFNGVDANRIMEVKAGEINSFYAGTDYRHWFITSGQMELGKGYASDGPSSASYPTQHQLSFNGIPNNGVIRSNVVSNYTNDEIDNWNLVGNPYPSALDAEAFLNHNSSVISGTIRLWTHSTTWSGGEYVRADYVSYNLTGGSDPDVTKNIGSSQGFMVEATTTGNIEFNNSMRMVSANNQFYKQDNSKQNKVASQHDRVWLSAKNSTSEESILIGFIDGATDGMDYAYDGMKYKTSNPFDFYSKSQDNKLIIQGLNAFAKHRVITIGLDAREVGSYSIGIMKAEGQLADRDIYLTDHQLNSTHLISKSQYEFDVTEEQDFEERFSLHFTENMALSLTNEEEDLNLIKIGADEGNLYLNATELIIEVEVFDILGRSIHSSNPNKRESIIALSQVKAGTVLIVNAKTETGRQISKKIIKR